MILIFYLSSQVADQSSRLSSGITEVILKIIKKVFPSAEFNFEQFNHIIRKNAHFFAYLVLGILSRNAFRSSGIKGLKGILLTLLVCVLYAGSDEIHQLFVPGRAGQIRDVLIDSAGAGVGVAIYSGIGWLKGLHENRIWKKKH